MGSAPFPVRTTLPRRHRAALRCARPPRWLAEPVGLALLLLLCLPTVRAAVVVAWCQPTPTREEDIPLLLLRPRAASNLLLLSPSPVPLASAPCQSTRLRHQSELSSNSSETSGRRRVLDSPVPPPGRLGGLLWKLVESQSSFVFWGTGGLWRWKRGRRWTVLPVSAASNTGVR